MTSIIRGGHQVARGWTQCTLAPLAGASPVEAWTGEGSRQGGRKRGRRQRGSRLTPAGWPAASTQASEPGGHIAASPPWATQSTAG